ncbi:MAG: four helix bundle protein [Bryobacterales bacterium]|nr:four helix bundle protein [Bryobacterales bacterium]
MGSASEFEYPLRLAKDREILDLADYQALNDRATEVKRMLTAADSKAQNTDRRSLSAAKNFKHFWLFLAGLRTGSYSPAHE